MNPPLLPEKYLTRDTDSVIADWIASDAPFLLVQGPRQVGKSASVGHALLPFRFESEYGYIDFASREIAEASYASSVFSETIIQDLLFSLGASLEPNAILFLDEIQNALPKDIGNATMQRKWIENLLASARKASVRLILTGSFLGLSLSCLSAYFEEHGFPILTIRSMSFHEFAVGKGFFDPTEWFRIQELCCAKKSLPLTLHRRVMDAFACYLYVGGMPICVSKFNAETGDLSQSERELADLTETAKNVLAQYMDIQGRETFFDRMLDLFYAGIKASDKRAFNKKAFGSANADPQFLDFVRRSEVGLLFFPPNDDDLLKAKIYFSDVGIMHYLAFHGRRPEHEAKDSQTGLNTLELLPRRASRENGQYRLRVRTGCRRRLCPAAD